MHDQNVFLKSNEYIGESTIKQSCVQLYEINIFSLSNGNLSATKPLGRWRGLPRNSKPMLEVMFPAWESTECEVIRQWRAREQWPSYACAAHISVQSCFFVRPLTSLHLCFCPRYRYIKHTKNVKVFVAVAFHRTLSDPHSFLSYSIHLTSSSVHTVWARDYIVKLIFSLISFFFFLLSSRNTKLFKCKRN